MDGRCLVVSGGRCLTSTTCDGAGEEVRLPPLEPDGLVEHELDRRVPASPIPHLGGRGGRERERGGEGRGGHGEQIRGERTERERTERERTERGVAKVGGR